MGKAEIKSSGRTREAKTGDLIKPGEREELESGSSLKLSASGGKAEITIDG
jgi:hypothetical protein